MPKSIVDWECQVDDNGGWCPAIMEVDNKESQRGVPCQCGLFGLNSYCKWVNRDNHERVYSLGKTLFKQSPKCHRKYMAHDILEIDWFHVRQCTDMPQDDFETLANLAHEWLYSAVEREIKG